MRNIFRTVFFGLFFGVCVTTTAQTPTQTPTQTQESANFIREKQGANRGINTLEGVLNPDQQNSRMLRPPRTRAIFTTRRDKELTSVDKEDKSKHSAFLRRSDTGILRLHDSENCDEEGRTIHADEPCPWNIVGKATIYSFRTENYTNKFFSDIQFEEKTFKIVGINLLGFLTDLGDVAIENLNLQSKGIKEMAEFETSTDVDEIKNHFKSAKNGFQIGDYFYKNELRMNPNKTYALRSIAYDSKVLRKVGRRKINLLEYDKRRDIIVVFRVVREHADGSINIIWKKIQSKSAPKIRSNK